MCGGCFLASHSGTHFQILYGAPTSWHAPYCRANVRVVWASRAHVDPNGPQASDTPGGNSEPPCVGRAVVYISPYVHACCAFGFGGTYNFFDFTPWDVEQFRLPQNLEHSSISCCHQRQHACSRKDRASTRNPRPGRGGGIRGGPPLLRGQPRSIQR